jgi:hypothetical protein
MSKDKGTKNVKKAPADKKGKAVSSYKSEGKSGLDKQPTLEAFIPKTDPKSAGATKKGK